jgi:hypothetical protein
MPIMDGPFTIAALKCVASPVVIIASSERPGLR